MTMCRKRRSPSPRPKWWSSPAVGVCPPGRCCPPGPVFVTGLWRGESAPGATARHVRGAAQGNVFCLATNVMRSGSYAPGQQKAAARRGQGAYAIAADGAAKAAGAPFLQHMAVVNASISQTDRKTDTEPAILLGEQRKKRTDPDTFYQADGLPANADRRAEDAAQYGGAAAQETHGEGLVHEEVACQGREKRHAELGDG